MDEPISEQELQSLGWHAKNNKGYESGMLTEKISAAYRAQREEIKRLERRNNQWSQCCRERDEEIIKLREGIKSLNQTCAAYERQSNRDATEIVQLRTHGVTEEEVVACLESGHGITRLIAHLRSKGLLTEDAPAASFVHVVGTPPNPPSVTVSSPSDYGKFDWASRGVDSNTPKMTTEERTRFDIRNLMESYCELVQRVEKLESPEREVVKVVASCIPSLLNNSEVHQQLNWMRQVIRALADGKRVEITTEGE